MWDVLLYIKYILREGALSVKYAILGLLHYQDMHGYRIKKHIENNFGHMWTINYGQVFTALRKMEEDGLVVMREVIPSESRGPNRKLYSITQKGREEFSRWLASFPERPMLIRDPFLLRFVFFGFGEPTRALEITENQIVEYEKQLVRREENMPRWKKQGDYVRLVSELGLELNRMYLDWLKRVREEITQTISGREKNGFREKDEGAVFSDRFTRKRGSAWNKNRKKVPGRV